MRMGHGPRRAVVILWLWTALLSAAVLLPTFTNRGNALVPLGVAALGLLLYIYFHPGVRSARRSRPTRRRPRRRPPRRGDRAAGRAWWSSTSAVAPAG